MVRLMRLTFSVWNQMFRYWWLNLCLRPANQWGKATTTDQWADGQLQHQMLGNL